MASSKPRNIFSSSDVLSSLPEQVQKKLEQKFFPRESKSCILFNKHSFAENIYLIKKGSVEILREGAGDDDGKLIQVLSPGSIYFIPSTLVDFLSGKRNLTYETTWARCSEDSEVDVLKFSEISTALEDPILRADFCANVVRRVKNVIVDVVTDGLQIHVGPLFHVKAPKIGKNRSDPGLTDLLRALRAGDQKNRERRLVNQIFQSFFRLSDEDFEVLCEPSVLHPANGSIIRKEGERERKGLILVLTGKTMCRRNDKIVKANGAGSMIGSLEVICSTSNMFTVTVESADTSLAYVSQEQIEKIFGKVPQAKTILASCALDQFDYRNRFLETMFSMKTFSSGDIIVDEASPGNLGPLMITSGKARSEKKEYSVGAVIEHSESSDVSTIRAVRETTVVEIRPSALTFLEEKLSAEGAKKFHQQDAAAGQVDIEDERSLGQTLTVLSADKQLPSSLFCRNVTKSLTKYGKSKIETEADMLAACGLDSFDNVPRWMVSEVITNLEAKFSFVFFLVDNDSSVSFRNYVTRQSDAVLILNNTSSNTKRPSKFDWSSSTISTNGKLISVFFYKLGETPFSTKAFVKSRHYDGHVHIRMNEDDFSEEIHSFADLHSDWGRLARFISGNSIALCLSGGGARGISHDGVLEFACKFGLHVDMIVGVSMGAEVAASFGLDCDFNAHIMRTRDASEEFFQLGHVNSLIWSVNFAQMFRSTTNGKPLDKMLKKVLGEEKDFEDLMIPVVVVATDLNTVGSIELSSGNVKKCVRASMSLLNWFPPVHDPTAPTPEQAHLLCDGCYSQNLPIKVAKKIAKFVVAVDAGWKTNSNTFYDVQSRNGIVTSIRNFFGARKIPSSSELGQILMAMASEQDMKSCEGLANVLTITPDLGNQCHVRGFAKYDEIKALGYSKAAEMFASEKGIEFLKSALHFEPKKVETIVNGAQEFLKSNPIVAMCAGSSDSGSDDDDDDDSNNSSDESAMEIDQDPEPEVGPDDQKMETN